MTQRTEPVESDWPNEDDWERISCASVGDPLHYSCGWCQKCSRPVFQCGHITVAGVSR